MDLREQIKNLPEKPGVYIYHDAEDNILYVGKAKILRNRVKQYFLPTVDNAKVRALVSHIARLEYIVVPSESDALSLENTLIKKHKPPYNIMLKDDKQYGYIKVSVKETYPRVLLARKLDKDGCKYFGPYTKGGSRLLDVVNACYPTVSCKHDLTKGNVKPCLAYHIGYCPAPCVNNIDVEQYAAIIKKVTNLLGGDITQAKQILTEKMLAAAEGEQYEQAQELKELMELLPAFQGGKATALTRSVNYDVFALAHDGVTAVCNTLLVRQGRVSHSQNYVVADAALTDEQTLSSFISLYYADAQPCRQILTSIALPDSDALAELLTQRAEYKVQINKGERGDRHYLVSMSCDNAMEYLTKSKDDLQKEYLKSIGAMEQLMQALDLPALPARIECYDISNVSGVDKVASMVVFTNGKSDNKAYRRFKIKTVEGADDFASMEEVLTRRLTRLKEGDLAFGDKPDLIVVDGGKGQLSSAQTAFDKTGVTGIVLVSLAKKEEIVFTTKSVDGVILPRASYALRLLTSIRDEAHRFAITYFRQLHGKNALKSVLSSIEGVGKKRQVELVRAFGNVERISKASVEELCSVNGMNAKCAQAVYDYFNNNL